jgi:beta-lactamase superfamily II metal-dependent hydrolase
MRLSIIVLLSVALTAARPASQTSGSLQLYVVDVEGGKAMLVVSPSGESLLVDSGNIGEGAQRDAGRILAAARDAGLQRIDHLITTHWHRDHVGAMALVARHLPIGEFIDHGANVQPDPVIDAFLRDTYPRLYRTSRHTVVKPGDTIPLAGIDLRVLTSAGESIHAPVSGTGVPNPYCADFKRGSDANTENTQSIGLLFVFGRFRAVDLGDLTVNKEFQLMCPVNPVGTVDLFMVSHHGQPGGNSQVLIHAIESRVAIMNNGTRKGGQPAVMKVIYTAPRLEDLWQLHASQLSGQEYTVPGLFVANHWDRPQLAMPIVPLQPAGRGLGAPPAHDGPAYWIKVSARQDGSFAIVNGRNGFSKTYRPRADALTVSPR